jgi:hypothetical protein
VAVDQPWLLDNITPAIVEKSRQWHSPYPVEPGTDQLILTSTAI